MRDQSYSRQARQAHRHAQPQPQPQPQPQTVCHSHLGKRSTVNSQQSTVNSQPAMAAPVVPHRIIPSYPHAQGYTKLAYSHDGKYLITAGADQLIRKFTVDEESKEPETFEQHTDPVTAIAASKNAFASASEDCTVSLFRMQNSADNVRLLTRCTLPVREVAFSPDGEWLGVASEYLSFVDVLSSGKPMPRWSIPLARLASLFFADTRNRSNISPFIQMAT
jgi:WD40 repeat protein